MQQLSKCETFQTSQITKISLNSIIRFFTDPGRISLHYANNCKDKVFNPHLKSSFNNLQQKRKGWNSIIVVRDGPHLLQCFQQTVYYVLKAHCFICLISFPLILPSTEYGTVTGHASASVWSFSFMPIFFNMWKSGTNSRKTLQPVQYRAQPGGKL